MPATDWEALKSPLMGLFEKRRAAKFLSYVQQYDERNAQVRGCGWLAKPALKGSVQLKLEGLTAEPCCAGESHTNDPNQLSHCLCRRGATGTLTA